MTILEQCCNCGKILRKEIEDNSLGKAEDSATAAWLLTSEGWFQLYGDPDIIAPHCNDVIEASVFLYLCPDCVKKMLADLTKQHMRAKESTNTKVRT